MRNKGLNILIKKTHDEGQTFESVVSNKFFIIIYMYMFICIKQMTTSLIFLHEPINNPAKPS